MKEVQMSDSVYKVVTLIGTSPESWEKAAKAAVEAASHSLRELRIAEVIKQDMVLTDGKVEAYRTNGSTLTLPFLVFKSGAQRAGFWRPSKRRSRAWRGLVVLPRTHHDRASGRGLRALLGSPRSEFSADQMRG
jgi:dodecin